MLVKPLRRRYGFAVTTKDYLCIDTIQRASGDGNAAAEIAANLNRHAAMKIIRITRATNADSIADAVMKARAVSSAAVMRIRAMAIRARGASPMAMNSAARIGARQSNREGGIGGRQYYGPQGSGYAQMSRYGQQGFGPQGYGPQGGGYRQPGMQGRFAGRGPRGYQRSDQRIQEDINDRLTDHPDIDASEIEIKVNGGEVTITGMVHERYAKRMTEDCVESVGGVKQVHNQLRVQQESGSQQHGQRKTAGSENPQQHELTGTGSTRR